MLCFKYYSERALPEWRHEIWGCKTDTDNNSKIIIKIMTKFWLHLVFYSLAVWCSAGSNGETGSSMVGLQQRVANYLRQQTIHKSYDWMLMVSSHTKRKLAMVSAPARSILATSLRKLYARSFFWVLFVEHSSSCKTKVKSNLSS